MIDMSWLPSGGVEMAVVSGGVGLLLLLAGRRLFWLALATAGFLTGFLLLPQVAPQADEAVRWGLAALGGVAGALLAIFVQRVAVAFGGFLLGGYGALMLADALAISAPGFWPIAIYVGGGILTALLAALLFEGALIVLSALLGAAILVQLHPLPTVAQLWLFLVLMLVGVAVQSRGWGRD